MKWWKKLSFRITISIFLIALVPLSGFGIITIHQIKKALLQSVELVNLSAARRAAGIIDTSVNQTINNIKVICENNTLESQDPYEQEWTLQMLLKTLPEISSFMISDYLGRQKLYVSREDSFVFQESNINEKLKSFAKNSQTSTIHIGQLSRAENGMLLLPVDFFLKNSMSVKNSLIITISINMTRLLEKMADQHLINKGYLYVTNIDGQIILHPDRSVALSGEKALYCPQVKEFIAGKKVPLSLTKHLSRDGQSVVSNAYPVEHPHLLAIVEQLSSEAFSLVNLIVQWQISLVIGMFLISAILSFYFILKLIKPLKALETGVNYIGDGIFDFSIPVTSMDEFGTVLKAFNAMATNLKEAREKDRAQSWIDHGLSKVDDIIRGERSVDEFGTDLIEYICNYINAYIGLFYTKNRDDTYFFQAGFAVGSKQAITNSFKPGQGLTGECIKAKKSWYIEDMPADFYTIKSGIGETKPRQLAIIPFMFNNLVEGVMELGMIKPLSDIEQEFLEQVSNRIAIAVNTARSRMQMDLLLKQTNQQKIELEEQQEELQTSNEELEEYTQRLIASEAKLKQQQEELQASNEELEEKTQYLEKNKKQIEEKNQTLELMQDELNQKADDLMMSSKYKSEFLANMSHELRTPLNSLLLLAKILIQNKKKNLTSEQIESLQVIFSSGSDLLSLINEILDLSKIEAGKMEIHISEFEIKNLADSLQNTFDHLAKEKGLDLNIQILEQCPKTLLSDAKRVEQVLKNLLSNAIKFTSQGSVQVTFFKPDKDLSLSRSDLADIELLGVSVQDSGIGIAKEKQKIIFEAFQQSEGGISRKYGGTGLGLSICRELAKLLGGEIQLKSTKGQGSVFTLYLPVKNTGINILQSSSNLMIAESVPHASISDILSQIEVPKTLEQHLPDDRQNLTPESKSVLIIEDDITFGKTLLSFCQERGFKCLYSVSGENGLSLARHYLPKAIILDIRLPGIDGWTVFDALKADPSTSHIPVHFMSVEEPVINVYTKGAIGYLTKPVSQKDLESALLKIEATILKNMKNLLIVEDNKAQLKIIRKLIQTRDISIDEANTAAQAINALKTKNYDCVILDLGLPDMNGFDLLETLKKELQSQLPPIIVYTGKDLSREEEDSLRSFSESIIIKGVKSEERLLDEASLFLHQMVNTMPKKNQQIIMENYDRDIIFEEKTILIVDDDMRNTFALSKVLRESKMKVLKAENGEKAINILNENTTVDLVLMDIMMPVMDGFEAMRKIRKDSRFQKLPIIALTAKAMEQDKQACIEAGANDYLTKPVDIGKLLSMMRVWLYE